MRAKPLSNDGLAIANARRGGRLGFDLEGERLDEPVSGINAVIDIASGAVKTRFPTVRAEEHVQRRYLVIVSGPAAQLAPLVQVQAP